MSRFVQVRQILRSLLRSPALAVVAVLTLAVGIAGVTLVFSVVEAVLLDPFPYPDAQRIVALRHAAPGLELEGLPQSQGTYLLYRNNQRRFEDIGLYQETKVDLTGSGTPARLTAARVTPSLFDVLGVSPRLGRGFREDGERSVAVLSHAFWQRRLGGDEEILGTSLRLDGREVEVVGVMPPGLPFLNPEVELWLPLEVDPATAQLGHFEALGYGRMEEGVSADQAEADLDRLLADLPTSFPESPAAQAMEAAGFTAVVVPLREELLGNVGPLLWIVFGAAGLLLWIAAANVGNLLLVRSDDQRRDRAIRMAMGAGRGQLRGRILVESLLLSLAAGLVGMLLAAAGLRLVLQASPVHLPRLEQADMDASVWLFALGTCFLTTLLAGLLPALRGQGRELAVELATGGRTAAGAGRAARAMRRFLVGFQLALAAVLVVGAGLLLRSFVNVAGVDPGFETRDLLIVGLELPQERYDAAAGLRLVSELVDRVASLPGVTAAGVGSSLPLSGSDQGVGHEIEGYEAPPGAPPPVLGVVQIGPGYLEAMGIPRLAGRTLEPGDLDRSTGAVLVSRSLAETFWPGGDALEKRLRPSSGDPDSPWWTVVGVVGDVRGRRLTELPRPTVYYPLAGIGPESAPLPELGLVARTAADPEAWMEAVTAQVAALDPDLPLAALETMEERVGRANARVSFTTLVLTLATLAAVLLAAVGVSAFIAYLIRRRTTELGVRIALGATPAKVRWLMLREALVTVVPGVVLGMVVAYGVTRTLESLLYGVSPLDSFTFVGGALALVAVALLATLVPAERAARIDPVRALSTEP